MYSIEFVYNYKEWNSYAYDMIVIKSASKFIAKDGHNYKYKMAGVSKIFYLINDKITGFY